METCDRHWGGHDHHMPCDRHAAELECPSIQRANLQEVDDAKVYQNRLGLGPIPRDCQSRNADTGPIPAPPAVQSPHGPCGIVSADTAGHRLVGCKQPVILTAAASITPIASDISMLTVCGKKLLMFLTASSKCHTNCRISDACSHCVARSFLSGLPAASGQASHLPQACISIAPE
jgi:hypothetical protein